MRTALAVSFLLAVASYITSALIDPDLWWHLTVGRWILANADVPSVDYWNLAADGGRWRAYSWSIEVIFALAERAGELRALIVLKLLIGAMLILSMAKVFASMSSDRFMGVLLAAFCMASFHSHFTLRPQSFVWVVFIWLLLWLQRAAEQGPGPRQCMALFMLAAAWANIHLSLILGLVCTALWLAPWPWRADLKSFSTPCLCLLSVLGGSLCTPYLGGEWFSLLEHSAHPLSFQTIAEFQPLNIMQYHSVFLILLVCVYAAVLIAQPAAVHLPRIALCCIFLLGALAVSKFMPFAVLVIAASLADSWGRAQALGMPLGRAKEALDHLRNTVAWFPPRELSFVFLCLLIVNSINLWRSPLYPGAVPDAAVDFIEQNNLPLPVLNLFGDGGYLIYRFSDNRGRPKSPLHRVPVDGRTNVVPPAVWNMYFQARRGAPGWRKYRDYFNPGTILWRADQPLASILEAEGKWCIVHRSNNQPDSPVVFAAGDLCR